ncbi:hypothetical protein BDV96DRAFT_513508 [Lophiotrema nucula]|uniref:BRCT domain-containing protein n=1 Tax=Lophiotrema nucula TaxID=690887 RepID=A0A6A5ZMS3_9PLEO|nr:hypothetical protein BDV96DRAFT_513508 [Lophiotrema nucula]
MGDTTMMDSSQQLYEDLTFTIIPNGLSDERVRQVTDSITANGGSVVSFDHLNGHVEDIVKITHIVSTTSDFPDYYQALDSFIHVIKPSWVDDCLRVSKMKNPRQYSPDPALFMSEFVVCCADDIPDGDKEAIEGGVLAMGGQVAHNLSKLVTHLVALDLDNTRCQLVLSKRLRIPIVLPHWFDDCLKVGRRIPESPYTLPDPEILKVDAGTIPPVRPSQQIRDATDPAPTHEPKIPTPPVQLERTRSIRAFEGKKVMLADDLALTDNLRGVISGIVRASQGEVTNNADEADMYVCNYRDGEGYVKASQANKDVGNLGWIYYMIAHGTWTNPMRRMLHYPRPRDGVPEFKDFRISISSYTGEARVYLENLVKATGAEFTKTFRQDNTHLITAHKQSEKCEAAQEWGIEVVNHLWIEESYAKCKKQELSGQRYTHFPPRTNLGAVLGQTEIDRTATEKLFFSKSRKPKPVKAAQPVPVPGSSGPQRVSSDPVARSSPLAEKGRRTKTLTEAVTPAARRTVDGKENETPGTTGSRGAKDRAISKLHDAAPDIAQFEKEMKRRGGVTHGGRREKDAEADNRTKKVKGRDSTASKRSFEEVEAEDESATEDELQAEPANKSKNKKAKKDKLTPIKFRMLVSKDDRWTNNAEKEANDKKHLREIGLFINEDYKNVNLLCAPKVVRTKKFVAALADAPTLVSTSYLDYALKHNKLPPAEKHLLRDPAFEETQGFNLEESLERAKQNNHHLLKNWTIFCTETVAGGFDTYKEIIVANGGECLRWAGRPTSITSAKRTVDAAAGEVSQNQEEDEGDVLYLISEPHKREFNLWEKFRDMAKKHDMVPRIVRTEWLLFVAMAQYVHFEKEWELNEDIVNVAK